MKKHIFTLMVLAGLILIPGISFCQGPQFLQAKQALSESNASTWGTDIDIDPTNGDILVSGYFNGQTIFDGEMLAVIGSNDIFVARYEKTGRLRWAEPIGGQDNDKSYGIAADIDGNTIVAGMFYGETLAKTSSGESDIMVAKLSPDGTIVWVTRFGGIYADEAFDVAVDIQGDIYVTGYRFYLSQVWNVFIAKLNGADGSLVWEKNEGGDSEDRGYGIAVDASGNVVVTGYFYATATLAGTSLTSYGDKDIFITRYGADDGTPGWAKKAGGAGNDRGYAVSTDASGNVFVTGIYSETATFETIQHQSAGGTDIFLAKYDASGNLLFAVTAGGPGDDAGWGIHSDVSGNTVITGEFSGAATFGSIQLQSAGNTDIFIAAYDADGNCLSAYGAGGTGSDAGRGVATVDGKMTATGFFQGISTFGDLNLGTHAANDMFFTSIGEPALCIDLTRDNKLGLEDAIGILQILSGIRP